MLVINEYEWLFDVVEFGIDVREFRLQKEWKQRQFDEALGLTSEGNYCSTIECGRTNSGMSMRLFLRICALMDVDPRRYFTVQRE